MQRRLALDIQIGFGDFDMELADELPLDGITGLFGPSGSGKSTVLRVVAGLERNARGRVAFDDQVWLDTAAGRFVEPWRRGVGFVFQDARLFPHLDVRGNLRFAERRSRHGAAAIDLESVLDALDLAPLLARRPASLSGGEQQRVAIARTLLARPVLLLMDEPLSALDLKRKAAILPYIEKLPELFGIPIVYVTHAIDEVARLATRMVVLDAGRVRAAGPLTEVLERLDLQPATGRFEAGVVISATVAGHDRRFRLTLLDCAGQTIVMPEADVETGATVRLRIRARDVALARTRPSGLSIRNILAGTIERIVEEPDTAFAETLVDIGGAAIRARLTRASVADLALKEGEPVFVLVKAIAFDRRAFA